MVVFLYTVHPNTKDKRKRRFMWKYTKHLANSKENRLLGLMMNLPSVSEWNGFLGCEAPKYENWVDISERTITIAPLKKIKKLHTTHSFWNTNFHCHFPLTLQNHCGIAVDFHARSCRHTAKMTRTTLSRDWAGQTSFWGLGTRHFLLGRCWHLGSTLDVNTYQKRYCFGRCQHLPKEVLLW